MQNNIKVGSVVKCTAGHDSGNYFVVIEVEDEFFVRLCDGKSRTLEKPKRKKIKHIKDTYIVLENIAEKLNAKAIVHNKNIQTALKSVLKQ